MSGNELLIHIKVIRKAMGEIDKLLAELGALESQVAQTNKAFGAAAKGSDKFNKAAGETTKKVQQGAAAVDGFRKKLDQTSKGMDQAGKKATGLKAILQALGDSTRWTAKGFGAMLAAQSAFMTGAALLFGTMAAIAQVIRDVVDMQTQFARVQRVMVDASNKVVDTTAAYQEFRKEMIRTGKSAAEVAEVMYQLGSAGLSQTEMIVALESTMNLLIGTEADLTTVTQLIAGVYNNFSESMYKATDGSIKFGTTLMEMEREGGSAATQMEKFVRINDLMVYAFRDNQIEINELVDGLKYSVPAAKAAGVGFEELIGMLSVLNNHMIKAGRAGRGLQAMMSRMAKDPVKFSEAFDVDIPKHGYLDLMGILEQLNQKYRDGAVSVDELGKMYTRLGLRGAPVFITLVTQFDKLDKEMKEMARSAEGANAAMAKIALGTLVANLQKLYQTIVVLADVFGGHWIDRLTELTGGLGQLAYVAAQLGDDSSSLSARFFHLWRAFTMFAGPIQDVKGGFEELKKAGGKELQTAITETSSKWDNFKNNLIEVGRFITTEVSPRWDNFKNNLIEVGRSVDTIFLDGLASKMDDAAQSAGGWVASLTLTSPLADLGRLIGMLTQSKDKTDEATQATEKLHNAHVLAYDTARAKAANLYLEDMRAALEKAKIEVTDLGEILGKVMATPMTMPDINLENIGEAEEELNKFKDKIDELGQSKALIELDFGLKGLEAIDLNILDAEEAMLKYIESVKLLGAATDVFTKAKEKAIALGNAVLESKQKVEELVTAFHNLEMSAVQDQRSIADSFGFGAGAIDGLISKIDSLERAKDEAFKKWIEKDDTEALFKLGDITEELTIKQKELAIAMAASKAALESESSILQSREAYLRAQISTQEALANSSTASATQRAAALDTLQGLQEKYHGVLSNLMKNEAAEIDRVKNEEIASGKDAATAEADALKKRETALGKYSDKFEKLSKDMLGAADKRIAAEASKQKELEAAYGKQLAALGKIKEKVDSIKAVFQEKWGENLMDPAIRSVEDLITSFDTAIQKAKDLAQAAKEAARAQQQAPGGQPSWYGGLRGGVVRVTAGEGFVPPAFVSNNLETLRALNSGTAMNGARNIPISKFTGPGGVDNIHTMVPQGSYIVSKKGMAAYDKATNDRERFALGGMVGGTDGGYIESQDSEPMIAFELTLNTQRGTSTHQVFGPRESVLAIKEQLERENLTKLR